MIRLRHTSPPNASAHNRVLRAVDKLGSAIMPSPGGPTCAAVLSYLTRDLIWQPSDFMAICSGATHQYGLISGAVPQIGLSHALAREMRNNREGKAFESMQYRYVNGHDQYQAGWGYYDWSDLTPEDYALSGLDAWRFDTQIATDGSPPVLTSTGFDPEAWSAASSGGSRACEHSPDYLRWYGMSSNPSTSYYTGPHWQCGTAGSGQYTNLPAVLSQSPPAMGNYIGGFPDPDTGAWGWASIVSITTPCPFGHNRWLRRIPQGSTVISAVLEVKVSGLQSYQRTNTLAPIVDGGGLLTGWDETYTEDTTVSNVGLALVGGHVPDGALRYDYNVLAASAVGVDRADAWAAVPVTELIQAMVDTFRGGSPVCRFGLVPTPYAGIIGATDTKGILAGLHPSVTLASFDDPGNANAWWGGDDTWYVSEASGQYVTWTGVELGSLAVEWQLPSGERDRFVVNGNMPPFN